MRYTKKSLIFGIIVSVATLLIILMFISDETKTWKINFALYFSLDIFVIMWLIVLCTFLVEKNKLRAYEINGYKFKPVDYDDYQEIRILFEEKDLANTQEEKDLLNEYRLKTNTFARANSYYLVFKEKVAVALIKINKNKRRKICNYEIIKSNCLLKNELNELLNNRKDKNV